MHLTVGYLATPTGDDGVALASALAKTFDAQVDDSIAGGVEPNWNVAPTHTVPILLERLSPDGQLLPEIHAARWGLVPSWAKELSIGSKMFNARSETVMEKPSFRAAVKKRRCAIPANGYYEWRKRLGPDGKPAKGTKDAPAKQPYFIHPPSESENIWFAGLYEWWQDPQGQWILSCSILTAESPDPDSDDETLAERKAALEAEIGGPVMTMSGVSRQGVTEVLRALWVQIAPTRARVVTEKTAWQP